MSREDEVRMSAHDVLVEKHEPSKRGGDVGTLICKLGRLILRVGLNGEARSSVQEETCIGHIYATAL